MNEPLPDGTPDTTGHRAPAPNEPDGAEGRRHSSRRIPAKWGLLAMGGAGLMVAVLFVTAHKERPVEIPVVNLQDINPAVKRAIDAAQRDVKAEPGSGFAWGRLGMVLLAHEYPTASIECFRQALKLDRTDFRWPYLLGGALETIDPAASIAAFREAVTRENALLPKLRLAEMLLQQHDLDAAEPLLRAILEAAPDDPRANYRWGQLLMHRGQIEAALSAIERAHEMKPRHRAIAELLSQLRHRASQAGGLSKDVSPIHLAEATETGWPDEILEQVYRLRRDPHWHAAQGASLIRSGQIADGIQELEAAASAAVDDWGLQSELARAYLKENRLGDAERLLTHSLERHSSAADLYRLRGSVRLLRREWDQAIADYRQAILLKADDAHSRSDLGFCLQQIDDPAGAKAEFLEALRLDPGLEAARLQLTKLLIQTGDYQGAKQNLELILRTTPNHVEALRLMGELVDKS